uniref:Uncharacterized protein n=1 Tax=Rhizophora mucronata TaxID=61149 RepID=A0A2P2N2X2_RHIMU
MGITNVKSMIMIMSPTHVCLTSRQPVSM